MRDLAAVRGAVIACMLLGHVTAAQAADGRQATAQEVVAKVREAALILARDGAAALARFRGKDSAFVWKDSYVFVSDCASGVLLTHPLQPEREGKKIADGPTYGGVTAAQRAAAQCAAARRPGGGWYAYPFPQPGRDQPVRKVSYILAVEGRSYIVGAGIYDDHASIAELDELTAD